MKGRRLTGSSSYHFGSPVQVNPADYRYNDLSALNGPFNGRIEGKDVIITYFGSGATITGKTNGDELHITFVGNTHLL